MCALSSFVVCVSALSMCVFERYLQVHQVRLYRAHALAPADGTERDDLALEFPLNWQVINRDCSLSADGCCLAFVRMLFVVALFICLRGALILRLQRP